MQDGCYAERERTARKEATSLRQNAVRDSSPTMMFNNIEKGTIKLACLTRELIYPDSDLIYCSQKTARLEEDQKKKALLEGAKQRELKRGKSAANNFFGSAKKALISAFRINGKKTNPVKQSATLRLRDDPREVTEIPSETTVRSDGSANAVTRNMSKPNKKPEDSATLTSQQQSNKNAIND